MGLARTIFTVVFGVLGAIITLVNWAAVIKYMRNKERHFSLVPLAGGIFLCLACVLTPNNFYIYLCWIPLLLDIGCVPAIIRALIHTIKSKKR